MRKLFEQGQRLGFDVLPRHFYSEISDIHKLKCSEHWKTQYSMIGVGGAALQGQLEFVQECCTPSIIKEIRTKNIHAQASKKNDAEGFGPIESDFLYAFVATKKPKQIFQIGCGVSTAVCLLAAKYARYAPEVICVEPYPTDYLIQECAGGRVNLIRQKAKFLDLTIVERLSNEVVG